MPRWLIPHLWGVDVALTAFLWAWACAEFRHTCLLGAGTMLLLASATWCCVIGSRVISSYRDENAYYSAFYRTRLLWLLLLFISLISVALWLLFACVGRGIIEYMSYVLLLMLWRMCFRGIIVRNLLLALAFAVACFAPTFYYAIATAPLSVFFSWQMWCVAGLLWLFYTHYDFVRTGERNISVWICCSVGIVWLLIEKWNAIPDDRGFHWFVLFALVCLHALHQLLNSLNRDVAAALLWLSMGLLTAVGVALFSPYGILSP